MNKPSRFRLYLEGTGLLLGMIIGAGIFGLPYAIHQSGIFWGLLHFTLALFLLLLINLLYGEVAYLTSGRHRFTGYVRTYLGANESRMALFLVLFGNYGALLVYGILGGIFLQNIFYGVMPIGNFFWGLVFFAVAGLIAVMRFEKAGVINFYLTVPLLGFIVYLIAISSMFFETGNLRWDFTFNADWFLPYGVWLFALSGFTVIPDARDVMKSLPIGDFKRVIWMSTLVAAVFSLIFAVGILGVTGESTTVEALAGLKRFLGERGILIGSIIGFLAVITSYIATAEDFKEIFKADYGIKPFMAWLMVVVPPVLLYVIKIPGLTDTLSFLGAAGFGVSGYFILRMSDKIALHAEARVSRLNRFIKAMIGAGIAVGAFYEIWNILL